MAPPSVAHLAFDAADDAIELVDETSAAGFAVRPDQRLVIRDDVVGAGAEALPHAIAEIAEIAQDRIRVVDLVRRGHAQARRRQRSRVLDVLPFALGPRLFRRGPGVGAVFDDARDGVAEPRADVVEA